MSENAGAANMAGMGAGVLLTNMMQTQTQPQQPQQQQNAGNAAGGNDQQKMIDLLKQLGELKAAGVLTEEEFNQKKAEILGKL